ncbi:hypothetical protein ACWGH8_35765 [Nonomuraea muscovyensis]|uniref:Uncharacterized protein n=1 Tax=Nonomuraea muscovyensis TaxID=1124761 RepID=A0A7X0C2C0_9ACTN|nr:hypothetical protein [Nonomuraea muscovyensis]MBB6345806.1 hypothetical protein [Nonomuraea muscovyensis]
MASEEAAEPTEHDPVESLIDDVIRDILNEASQSTKVLARGGDSMATLIEAALTSAPRAMLKASTVERLLLAQVLASALADALAPALAEALTPEIMKVLEQYSTNAKADEPKAARGTTATARGSSSRKKT